MIRLPYWLRRSEGRPCKVPHWGGLRYKFESICENLYIKYVRLPEFGLYLGKPRKKKVIVSLTSFPARIDISYYAIKSLMLQSFKADKIILWLSHEQFSGKELPGKFDELIRRGLEIRFTEEDLRSHKKYYYILQEQKPDEVVITYDDDIIYEKDSIEKLIKYHLLFPKCIICNRAQQILFNNETIEPFKKWPIFNNIKRGVPKIGMIPSTGAGCLYPYKILPKTAFNLEIIKKEVFTTDDLWIGFNNIISGNYLVKTLDHPATLICINNSQKEALTTINNIEGENSRSVKRLLKIFPQVHIILKDEN